MRLLYKFTTVELISKKSVHCPTFTQRLVQALPPSACFSGRPIAAIQPSSTLTWHHSLSSLAIFEAMFLNPIEVPEIRLNRTPLRESLGSLQTSISHCTKLSVLGSPCTHSNKNFSRCS